jgi:hypothetical protein
MGISSIVTRGFGNGVFNGSPPLIITHGFGIAPAAPEPASIQTEGNDPALLIDTDFVPVLTIRSTNQPVLTADSRENR